MSGQSDSGTVDGSFCYYYYYYLGDNIYFIVHLLGLHLIGILYGCLLCPVDPKLDSN